MINVALYPCKEQLDYNEYRVVPIPGYFIFIIPVPRFATNQNGGDCWTCWTRSPWVTVKFIVGQDEHYKMVSTGSM